MKARSTAAVFPLVLATLWLVSPTRAGGRQPSPPERATAGANSEQIDTLVRDLGSDQFSIRQRATRELIALGIVARDALERATRSSDAEVRTRARAILRSVRESDFQDRLAAFSADFDGSLNRSLPSWEQFSTEFGAGRAARQLFVEMQRAEPALLEAFAEGNKPASDALAERTEQLLGGGGDPLTALGTQASLLFVASAEGVDVTHLGSMNIYSYVVQSMYQRHRKSPLWPAVLRRIVGRWLSKDNAPAVAARNLVFAAQVEMASEALTIAERILTSGDSAANSRQMAILVLARFGQRSQGAILEELLDDATPCGVAQARDPASKQKSFQRVELQIRDVALAALLYLNEQDLRDYGFSATEPFSRAAYQPGAIGFIDDPTRAAAMAKWAQWRAEQPDRGRPG